MALPQIVIGVNSFDTYLVVADADVYMVGAQHGFDTWDAAETEVKQRALITATRILDRQKWLDAYDTQDERLVEQRILDAAAEMALALIEGSDLQTAANTSQKLSSIKAGSVALTYFRGAEGRPRRFPQIVYELLRDFLASSELELKGVATGVGGVSSTVDEFGHTEGF